MTEIELYFENCILRREAELMKQDSWITSLKVKTSFSKDEIQSQQWKIVDRYRYRYQI